MAAIPGRRLRRSGDVLAALRQQKCSPNCATMRPQPQIGFIHKIDREDGSEFFFLRNRTRDERTVDVTLRPEAGRRCCSICGPGA